MTLGELYSKFFTRPTVAPPTAVYVFEAEDDADNWIGDRYFGGNSHAYILVCVLCSDMIAEYTLKKEWVEGEIQQFYAVEPDVLVAVVKPKAVEVVG